MKITLDKVIRAMSIALDLAELSSVKDSGVVEEITNINYSEHKFKHHAQRTTYIAIEIAKALDLDIISMKELYISSLIHDIGATNSLEKSHSSKTLTFIKDHCEKGARITSSFPIFNNISNDIRYHHENWDGSGPMNLKGNDIPLKSQIIRMADLVEVLYNEKIPPFKQNTNIIAWINGNSNIIFSQNLVDAFLKVSKKDIFWFNMENIYTAEFILDSISPSIDEYLEIDQFNEIAYIFASLIDDKSKFTAKHSIGISELAYNVAQFLGYDEEKCIKMKIAGLLHDIGKLAIPSSILDKNGSLSCEEFSVIKSHVYYTKIILDRIEGIDDISEWASNHHEKLNGKGYVRGLNSDQLSEESRILAVCDIYQALTEDRPYRKGLDNQKTFAIMDEMVTDGFICSNALKNFKKAIGYV